MSLFFVTLLLILYYFFNIIILTKNTKTYFIFLFRIFSLFQIIILFLLNFSLLDDLLLAFARILQCKFDLIHFVIFETNIIVLHDIRIKSVLYSVLRSAWNPFTDLRPSWPIFCVKLNYFQIFFLRPFIPYD